MATVAPPKLFTADELLSLPDDGTVYELSRGMLLCMSPSSLRPSRVAGRVHGPLFVFVEARQLGEVGSAEGGFRLASDPDTVRAPDVWFVRTERLPLADAPDGFFIGAPDLAIEVLSPSDRFGDIALKVRDYLEAGTPLIWVLDPRSRTTAVFRPGAPVRFLDADGMLDGEDVLRGFTLPLRDVWR